jgi:hypothetical protein
MLNFWPTKAIVVWLELKSIWNPSSDALQLWANNNQLQVPYSSTVQHGKTSTLRNLAHVFYYLSKAHIFLLIFHL